MQVESIAFCNSFDLHYAIIGLENQFLVFLRVVVLDRIYCTFAFYKIVKTIIKQKVSGATNFSDNILSLEDKNKYSNLKLQFATYLCLSVLNIIHM